MVRKAVEGFPVMSRGILLGKTKTLSEAHHPRGTCQWPTVGDCSRAGQLPAQFIEVTNPLLQKDFLSGSC